MNTLIDKHTGIVKLPPKQGKKPSHNHVTKEVDTRQIQICLNCDRPNCKGNCKKMKGERDGTIH